MKRNILLKLLPILTVLGAILGSQTRAASPTPVGLNLGFYEENSPEIPAAVRNQKKLIYRFNMPYFSEVLATGYGALLENPNISTKAKADLKDCSTALLPVCMIPFGEIRGTAFLDENGTSIWTNCHLVSSWIEYKKQKLLLQRTDSAILLKKLMASPIPFSLVKTDGSLAFSSAESTPASLEALHVQSRSNIQALSCSLQSDAVKIRLPLALASKGIPRSKNYPLFQANQKNYIGGNPRATTSRSFLGKLDSDGNHFYWTTGNLLLRGPEFDKYFESYIGGSIGLSLNGPNAQALRSDSIEGMSGGPALNEFGELVGIYKGFLPLNQTQRDIPFVSLFLDKNELRFIEIYSESL